MGKRIGLLDNMLKYSEYVGGAQPEVKLIDNFFKKIDIAYLIVNILIPCVIVVIILYICKEMMKKYLNGGFVVKQKNDISIPIEYTFRNELQ